MAVYALPQEWKDKIPPIRFDGKFDYKAHQEAEKKFLAELKEWIISHLPSKVTPGYTGEVIRFPMADSYAQYMVIGLKPVNLLHLPLGDGWDFQFADRVTAKEVRQMVDGAKKMKEMLAKKKEGN